jgi:hypothetical protein
LIKSESSYNEEINNQKNIKKETIHWHELSFREENGKKEEYDHMYYHSRKKIIAV